MASVRSKKFYRVLSGTFEQNLKFKVSIFAPKIWRQKFGAKVLAPFCDYTSTWAPPNLAKNSFMALEPVAVFTSLHFFECNE
jgi:hypothetical protein